MGECVNYEVLMNVEVNVYNTYMFESITCQRQLSTKNNDQWVMGKPLNINEESNNIHIIF